MSLPKPYYEEAGIVIYNADCRSILPHLEPVDLVLTDPPYGVTANVWDETPAVFFVFDKVMAPIVCTSQNPFSAELITRLRYKFKWSDVWIKSQPTNILNCNVMPLRKHEDVLVFSIGRMPYAPQMQRRATEDMRTNDRLTDGHKSANYGKAILRPQKQRSEYAFPTSVLKFNNSQDGQHPTQKPIELFQYLALTYSLPAQTILDPFMGSGTTLRAAKDLGRKAIGIEIEERYAEIAAKRLQQEVLQLSFEGPNGK